MNDVVRFTLEHHFGGTARKEEYINEVYAKWKALSIEQRKDPVRLMKIGFLSYQKAKDEYHPLFKMMLEDEEEGKSEPEPDTKVIHLGTATKRVPVAKESRESDGKSDEIPTEPYEPVKKSYRNALKSKEIKREPRVTKK